jgi:hypothetical protein
MGLNRKLGCDFEYSGSRSGARGFNNRGFNNFCGNLLGFALALRDGLFNGGVRGTARLKSKNQPSSPDGAKTNCGTYGAMTGSAALLVAAAAEAEPLFLPPFFFPPFLGIVMDRRRCDCADGALAAGHVVTRNSEEKCDGSEQRTRAIELTARSIGSLIKNRASERAVRLVK